MLTKLTVCLKRRGALVLFCERAGEQITSEAQTGCAFKQRTRLARLMFGKPLPRNRFSEGHEMYRCEHRYGFPI